MPENNPMTGGMPNNQPNMNQALEALSSMQGGLQSTTKELKELLAFLRQHLGGTGTQGQATTKNLSRLTSDLSELSKSLEEFKKFMSSATKEAGQTIKALRAEKESLTGITKNIDAASIDKQIKILDDYAKALIQVEEQSKDTYEKSEKAQKVKDRETAKSAKLNDEMNDLTSSIQALNVRVTGLQGSTSAYDIAQRKSIEEEIDRLNTEYHKKEAEKEEADKNIERANRRLRIEEERQRQVEKQINDIERIRNERLQQEQEQHRKTTESVKAADGAFRQLASQSTLLSDWLESQEKEEQESFNDTIKRTQESLQKTIAELTKQIETDTSLSEEERDNLKQMRVQLQRQNEALDNFSPAAEDLHKAGKELVSITSNTLKNILNNVTKQLESRYLTVYVDAFDRVYNSIENTRNTVSARLRLDQGGFEELQSSIMEEIDRMGLTGSVSAVDVNEALVELSSAGITDQETLQELALESAKLKAQGSSLNLSNEETITRIMTAIQQGMSDGLSKEDALGQVTRMLEDVGQAEILAREQFGQDLSLAHGGLDAIINQALDAGTAAGKTLEQISKDAQSGVMTSVSANVAGIDPAMIQQLYQDIAAGKITEQSAFGNILLNKGLTPEELLQMSTGEAYAEIASVLQQLVQNQDPNYLASVMQNVYGLSGSTYDYMRLANAKQGVIKTQLTDEDYDRMEELSTETAEALDEGTYKSRTEQVRKKAENAVDEIALTMEQFYEGDKLFHAVTDPILGGISQVVTAIGDLGYKMIAGSISGGSSYWYGAGGATGSTMMSDFLHGTSGTALGNVGTGLGVAAGAGMSLYSIGSNISQYNGTDVVEGIFTDPTFYAGVGTTLGSIIGGPIGGAVGGVVGGAASTLGNKIGDWILDWNADPVASAAEELKNAATDLSDSAITQYKTAKSEYDRLSQYTKAQKENALVEKGILSSEELKNKTEKEIQDLFYDNVLKQQELLMAESDKTLGTSQLLTEHAQDFANLASQNLDTAYEFAPEDMKEEFFTSGRNQFEGSLGHETLRSIFDVAESGSEMSVAQLQNALAGTKFELASEDQEELAEQYRKMMMSNISEQAGFGEGTTQLLDRSYEEYLKRKEGYEKADEQFIENWKKAEAESPDDDIDTIRNTYMKKFGLEKPPSIVKDEDGSIHLDPGRADYVSNYEGSFATGLTDVPYDGYKAILHQGERVLTSEEARAYNDLSSSVLEQISNGGNESFATYMNSVGGTSYESIFNSKTFGTDELNTSINNQTSTLEQKLDAILNLLKTFVLTTRGNIKVASDNSNVLRMNSNVTQLNTI